MPHGTVKFFNAAKGFGFITSDEGRKDVFVPAASITAAGIATLKTGQRVLFEETPDGKGPKATNLKLVETPAAPDGGKPRPDQGGKSDVAMAWTLYCDQSLDESAEVLAGLRAAGHEPRIVDYITAPPTRDELKRLSALLRGGEQSLVRKYDHLFGELRLDDRFIGENEFWDAIVEHPSLINGPVVATATKAGICHSKEALKAFLNIDLPNGSQTEVARKVLSPRLLKLMRGESPAPDVEQDVEKVSPKPVAIIAPVVVAKKVDAVIIKEVAKAKPANPKPAKVKAVVKAKAKAPAKAKATPTPKTKKPAKAAAKKPVKKSRRA